MEPLIEEDFALYDRRGDRRAESAVEAAVKAMVACAKDYARADTARRVYGKPDAGVNKASGWLRSAFPEVRELGLITLVTIDSPSAAAVLKQVDLSAYPNWLSTEARKVIASSSIRTKSK